MIRIPCSTYRLQFHSGFTFKDALKILNYLNGLGLSDIYASPIFKAQEGSTHGYDVVDPNELSPTLGEYSDFERLTGEVQDRKMGWLQDIVPNHMAISYENEILADILENGPHSKFYEFFDIEWHHPYESIKGRLLAPFLGRFYNECLDSGEIQIKYDANGFTVNYYDLRLPLKIESYATILKYRLSSLKKRLGAQHPDYIKLVGLMYVFRTLDSGDELGERLDQVRFIKRILWELYSTNLDIRQFVEENVRIFNGAGPGASYNLLDSLLSEQLFRLAFWKVSTEETNYRRFFNINGLISLRVERDEVFRYTHNLILRLVDEGKITGLRIDHIDGLYDPEAYLEKLRNRAKNAYIVVEKIVDLDEDPPSTWPIQGTTGYEFINYVNSVYCDRRHEKQFTRLYNSFIQHKLSYVDLVYDKKKLIIDKDMSGDVDNLAMLLKRFSANDRYGNDITLNGLRRAIVEVLACFPVYRTYISQDSPRNAELRYIEEAMAKAKEKRPDLIYELNFVQKFLLLQFDKNTSEEEEKNWIAWTMRFQQMTGPLMAKGFEDTTLYIYTRLISLNEVGGNPSRFGISVDDLHRFSSKRSAQWPHALSEGSTHDTKRGEDVRARINVLSEIPAEWETRIKIWNKLNHAKKTPLGKINAPDRNDEYFLYQALLGTFPFEEGELTDYVSRVRNFIIKAIREAKQHTEWLKPDSAYEEAFITFTEQLLETSGETNLFLKSFLPFQNYVAFYGILNSLSQTFLRLTLPGVPDIYQGTELWDLSFVDPDNRRPVDFDKRKKMLKDILSSEQRDIAALVRRLWETKENGQVKLFLLRRLLKARGEYLSLFKDGGYIPLRVQGKYARHVIAFARRYERQWAIAIVGRFFTRLVKAGEAPIGPHVWGDTSVEFPMDAAPTDWVDAISEQERSFEKGIPLGDVLDLLPVTLLLANER